MVKDFEKNSKQLLRDGYVILPGVLSRQECDRLKGLFECMADRLTPQYAGSKVQSGHGLENKRHEKIVYNIHNKHPSLLPYIADPATFPLAKFLLQQGSYQEAEPVVYSNSAARTPLPGCGNQQLHIDSKLPGCEFALSVQVLYMLDDFTANNGATRIVPGSHLTKSFPENGKTYPNEILATAPRGSVLIFHAGLWHGSGSNMTEGDRWAMILTYGRWWTKPSFDFNRNMPAELYNQLSDEQKEVMGYRFNPPADEFTRISRRSEGFEAPAPYRLPVDLG